MAASRLPAAEPDFGTDDVASLRTRTTQTFKARGGSYAVRVSSGESLNYRDSLGRWQPIDNRLTIDGDHLRNGANRYSVSIPRRLGSEAIRVSDGDAWIEFAPQAASAEEASLRGSEATFAGVWPGVELRYAATADSVKEALVVRDLASVRDFAFDLSVPPGYTPVADRFGAVAVRDAEGVAQLHLSRSTMIDAAGAISNSASELRRGPRGWELVQIPDRKWLSDPSRKWPVTIDPTVSMPRADLGCWIYRATTGPNCLNGAAGLFLTDEPDDVANDPIRALVHFDLDDALPPGAVVEYAAVDPHATLEDLPPEDIAVYEMTESWDENVDWYTRDGTTAWAGDPLVGGAASSVAGPYTAAAGGQTDMVRRWVSGENPNYGVQLRKIGGTSEYTSVSPTLTIQYAETDDPDGPVVEAMVASYLNDEPITTNEALRRISLQGRLSNIYDDLEQAIDDADNGGFWIDDNDAGRIKINIKTSQSPPPASKTADAEDVLEDHDFEGYVDFVSVAHSYDVLVAAQDSLVGALAGTADETDYRVYPEIESNRLVIQKSDALSGATSNAIDDAVDDLPVATHLEVVPAASLFVEPTSDCGERDANDAPNITDVRLACDLPFRAGTVLMHAGLYAGCTLAFGVRDADDPDERFVATAGHCLEQNPATELQATLPLHPGERDTLRIGYPRRVWDTQKGYDFGLISVESLSTVVPEISDGSSFGGRIYVTKNPASGTVENENYPVRRVSFAAAKQRVCTTSSIRNPGGRHTVCGKLITKGMSSAPAANGRVRIGLGLVQTCDPNVAPVNPGQEIVGGFSGSPTFNEGTALGILSGGAFPVNNPDNGIYCGFGYSGAKDLERETHVKIIRRSS